MKTSISIFERQRERECVFVWKCRNLYTGFCQNALKIIPWNICNLSILFGRNIFLWFWKYSVINAAIICAEYEFISTHLTRKCIWYYTRGLNINISSGTSVTMVTKSDQKYLRSYVNNVLIISNICYMYDTWVITIQTQHLLRFVFYLRRVVKTILIKFLHILVIINTLFSY